MEKTEKFFIFSWKELVVIGLLVFTSIGFFFTLGLHYGKKLHGEPPPEVEVSAPKLEESPESVPPKETLTEGSQHVESAAKDAIKSATEETVKSTELKVDHPKPVDLPKEKIAPAKVSEEESPETHEAAPVSKYAVQLGSFPNRKEAQGKINILMKRGLKPEVRTAQVNGETRYRVVLSGFKTRQAALEKGNSLRSSRKIENFVVIKSE